ncbi:hypothetical protein TTHERM_00035240 (macronuclear) [Tetrahymena thermophila SB210]|uniref:Uncharacterized protein n=1 Tax=Tetrahymena thermophila (strain SB210) TaxID=312017 RepID=Q22MJ6_TETTS|nr:hypothetical protein TTHERM_00035240 [Tetrahymena thermophila SB210]EAR86531.2 hypothetical protein TTHERM_00035240 [Tetrahymena thermophila SB210]|eukprot:XP_977024.2 hypothetical protein TTHERM_00035240 [Tetrahymena thermophila SB210]
MQQQLLQDKVLSSSSSPRQSQNSCESSTERMNRAQTNHQQLNPYQEQLTFKNNSFFTKEYGADDIHVDNKYQKKQNQQQNKQTNDLQLKNAVSQMLVEGDELELVELGDSSILKKSSNIAPPAPNPSQIDGKNQFKDIATLFKNNYIFLDEEINIKCTTSQILSKKDDYEESAATVQKKPQNQFIRQTYSNDFDDIQESPKIGRNNEQKQRSPSKGNNDQQFGRQIMSEYICQEKEASPQASNTRNQQQLNQTTLLTNNNVGTVFQYANSVYTNNQSQENNISNQAIQNKVVQSSKYTNPNDSINSFSSNQLSSVDHSKGSSNQSIKLENNVQEEEFKNKIGLESLSILRSEVNQFLGLLQSYNNEILASPKHQQLILQKQQSLDEQIHQEQQQNQSPKKTQEQEQNFFQKKMNKTLDQKLKEEYNQKLGEYLDGHKEMSEFFVNTTNEQKKQNKEDKYNNTQDYQQDLLIRSKLQMSDSYDQNQIFQNKKQIDEASNIIHGDQTSKQQYIYVQNYCEDQQSPTGNSDYESDTSNQIQQQLYSLRKAKKSFNSANFNNLSIIFSESEKSSPLIQSNSSQSQESSQMLGDNNKEVIEDDVLEQKSIIEDQILNSQNTQDSRELQKNQLNSKQQCSFFDQNNSQFQNNLQKNDHPSQQLKESQNNMSKQSQQICNNIKEKNKNFSFDVKNFNGVAEELIRQSDNLQLQINQIQNNSQIQRNSPNDLQERLKSAVSVDSCNTSINLEYCKKAEANESLVYLQEAFQLCLSDLKGQLSVDMYQLIQQKLKSVQQAYHSHIQLEVEKTNVLEKKNENLNKSNEMIMQALQATKEEIKQLIQNYQLLSEDHNELLESNREFMCKEQKLVGQIEKIEKERQHLKYLILVANEKYEKMDEKCNQLIKKNSILNEQISNMQNQFSNINQILREVIINLQENKDSEIHNILQKILKEANEMMIIKKDTDSLYSRYSHYSPNASCSAKQTSFKEGSLGRVQKTRSSSPQREGISPPTKSQIYNQANNSLLNISLKHKENKYIQSQQNLQGVGAVFQNISTNQTINCHNNSKKVSNSQFENNKLNKQSVQQPHPAQLNQSLGNIKQKENINRQKTPPKIIQKQGLTCRSKEDQRKIEETYRQIFLKQLKQSKIKDISNTSNNAKTFN